jgi:alanyl-tRNA synthetase
MTSSQIRQSFLDFFKSKQHTIVPSSSLMPDSPNLLFTNAGMNQFVPIFLGERKPDVSRWAGAIPGLDTRAADTQKCIRAGGKHNDLDDVGLDTYHHTFFEMLGNWSFGDYFKKEAIEWAWELVVDVWKFPPQRLYATVYAPDKSKGDPSEFDQEAWDHWARLFRAVGLDPAVHIVNGGKKDNFWMMGDTGPCGPCSELHVDLTPAGDTRGALVNKGTAECIEIWNLVFIQFNANPDGTFSPLPARHVDTGMGFERVTSIIQGTKNLTDFANAKISNYETDIFRPIFDALERLSGKKYGSTLPKPGSTGNTEQEKIDVAFRVIGDHIRTLSFAIADGIQPGNTDRNYVLRRILRRAVRYGRTLGFHEPFFYKLVGVLAETMGDVFPEIRAKKKHVQDVIRIEEEAFNKTLDRGIALFNEEASQLTGGAAQVPGAVAFELYDTYGIPLDLTELMARERGLTVDKEGFEKLMEEQRARARAAQKKEVISLSQIETTTPTKFVGFETLETPATVLEVVSLKDRTAVVLDTSACYAEMGGQVGDTGELTGAGLFWRIVNTQKTGNTWLHFIEGDEIPAVGAALRLRVDRARRAAIQRHHTVTHLLHWALHELVSQEASQKGSFVGPDKLTFDFNSAPLTPQQVADIEKLVNERILENAGVSWTEVPYAEVKSRKDVMQFFGDKYGDTVRVVQIGGRPQALDGYSMELCGGTHTRATGEIGLFRIVGESAIAAGVRRIEAVAGLPALEMMRQDRELIRSVAGKVTSPVHELEKKIEALLAHQKALEQEVQTALLRNASNAASELLERAHTVNGIPLITHNLGDANADFLQATADALKGRFKGVVVLSGGGNGAVTLIATVSPEFTARVQAGKIIQQIAPVVGGKGGGRPDHARGGGKDVTKIDEALAKVRQLLG